MAIQQQKSFVLGGAAASRRRCSTAIAMVLFWLTAAGAWAQSNDMVMVKTRIKQSLAGDLASVATIQGYQATLQPDGTWADIDSASMAQAYWSPRTHLDRMKAMTVRLPLRNRTAFFVRLTVAL